MIYVLDKMETIVRKGDNAGHQYFSPFSHNVFKSCFSFGLLGSCMTQWLSVYC